MYQPANVYNNQFRMPLSQIFSVLNLLQIEYQKDETLQNILAISTGTAIEFFALLSIFQWITGSSQAS